MGGKGEVVVWAVLTHTFMCGLVSVEIDAHVYSAGRKTILSGVVNSIL